MLVGGVAMLVCTVVLTPDPAGRAIMAIAGLMLLGFGVYAAVMRPRLALAAGTPPTLTMRRMGGTVCLTPDQVERVRVLTMRRIGRRSGQLEIDYADGADPDDSRLAVFGRWDLGTDVVDVADALARSGFSVDNPAR